jgi:hypothetical protein
MADDYTFRPTNQTNLACIDQWFTSLQPGYTLIYFVNRGFFNAYNFRTS